jgi:protein SCO1/2
MKKNAYIGITAVILLFGIIFIPDIVDRIKNGEVVQLDRMSNNRANYNTQDIATTEALETFGQVPPFSFVNQDRDTITNSYYTGKVYVVEFFFTTCPSICPVMNTNMQKVQQAFHGDDRVGIASISIDPTYDTPQVLKEYANSYDATHPHWHFLTGDKEAIMQLSNEGFKLYAAQSEQAEGGFEHSGMFALIDQEGHIRSRKDENGNPIFYYNGLEEEGVDQLIEDIKKLL